MTCREVGRHLAGYLDGAMSGQRHATVHAHLSECSACRADLDAYGRLARLLADAAPVTPPADLATRIRVQASHAQFSRDYSTRIWARVSIFFENILRPLAVPATGGLLTAAFAFVFLVQSLIVGIPMGTIPNDLPTDLIQPARLESLAPFPAPGMITGRSGASLLIVEATLNAEGQVADYKILMGPNTAAIRHEIDQVLIFSRFQPELNFGRPTSGGQVVLSFSEIRVQG
ncbi:MAG TPA: zf-HC2 domain-containing protein [Candidatus Acidoferrales bacterium]|nr:zf-HC2 domain-containing protein [Candidatus Acidoferrales bacterium]